MNAVILTPEREIFNGGVQSIKVPGYNGSFEVLKNHAPIVASLTAGHVRVIDDANNTKEFTIKKGFIEVLNNEVSVLVEGVIE